MPEDLPTPDKSLKDLEKEKNVKLSNNNYKLSNNNHKVIDKLYEII